MSVKIMGAVWDLQLPAAQMLVLLAMADHADHEGNKIFPSIDRIAWKTGYSESQVRRIIKKLVKAGVVTRQERKGFTNLYSIDTSKGVKKPAFEVSKRQGAQNDTPVIAVTPPPLHSYDTPTPVIAVTPEPSVQPSKQPSSSAKPKANSPIATFRDEWNTYAAIGDELLKAFDLDFVPAANQTMAALTPYLEVARELTAAGAEAEEIPYLHRYITARARREEWSKFGVKTLSRYYTDFLRTRRDKIIPSDPALDLSKPVEITPILMRNVDDEVAS